jgi:L-ascorbate metabolism protein UlaG (beta-lactamase superfamily)
VLLELDGIRVLTDPVLGRRLGPLLRVGSPVAAESFAAIDAVLLSHLHADHADVRSLRRVGRQVTVLAPAGAATWLRGKGLANVRELRPGDAESVGPVTVTAVPAQHDGRRHPLAARSQAIGFLLEGSRSVYFAGDTALFPEMERISDRLDVALVPVGGWGPTLGPGHLDPMTAAQAVRLLTPRVAIPIHWGTLALPWHRAPGHADAGRVFAAQAEALAPGVQVRVLRPGEQTTVE